MNTPRFCFLLMCVLTCGAVRAASTASASVPENAGPRAVPTFTSVGLYWRPAEGASDRACTVRFRTAGTEAWRDALPLWFDATDHPAVPEHSREYRGSIVGLEPATTYEIELKLAPDGLRKVLSVRTWDERFKIARTITLPEHLDAPFRLTEGGSEADGYVLYTPAPGRHSSGDAAGRADINLEIAASYVILRGVELRGARRHGIELGAVHHVVIEGCDISGWGENLEDGFGRNLDSAIYHATPDGAPRTLRHVVIQNNRLHHPRSNANSWLQPRATRGGNKHPIGPQGISLVNADGELVIRHNEISSDFAHMFNDAMGEYHNFGFGGFPGHDADVYGNRVSHCWDDGLEIEGANMNVRVWANVIDWTFDGIGCAATSLGPCYLFRNIYLHSRRGPGETASDWHGQYFLKLGADPKDEAFSHGRIYVFHNSVLQPTVAVAGISVAGGADRGLALTARNKHQTQIVSRNNLLWLREDAGAAVYDPQRSDENDFDGDLSNGRVDARPGSEPHGIHVTPQLAAPLDPERPWTLVLKPGTPGHDAALPIANFNETGSVGAPDVGALEAGRPVPADFPDERRLR